MQGLSESELQAAASYTVNEILKHADLLGDPDEMFWQIAGASLPATYYVENGNPPTVNVHVRVGGDGYVHLISWNYRAASLDVDDTLEQLSQFKEFVEDIGFM